MSKTQRKLDGEFETSIFSPKSPLCKEAWKHMTQPQKDIFRAEYVGRKRNVESMILLAIFFPIQLAYLNRGWLQFAYFMTFGGFGLWWIIGWFITPSQTRSYNKELERQIMSEMGVSYLVSRV